MNEHLLSSIVWIVLTLIFGGIMLWGGYEMSKPPLGNSHKK